jgi:hypothetical protein
MAEMTQDQLDNMSVEDLEQHVAQEGAFEAPGTAENGQAEATSGTAEATKPVESTQKVEEPPKWFQEYAQNMKRELGSFRSQQGNYDKLQKKLEQTENYLRQLQNQQNLSPEDRQAQAQLQTQQEQLAAFVRAQARAEFGEVGKDYIQFLDKLKEQQQDLSHRDTTLGLVREVMPEGAEDAWQEVFKQSLADIEAEKPGAIERQMRLEKDPAYVALAMIQAQRGKVQTQAAQVTQNRQAQAKQAAQGLSVMGSPKAGSKALNNMSDAELDKLSIAELEAGIPEQ